jgi:zinc transport system substrate-binding protein
MASGGYLTMQKKIIALLLCIMFASAVTACSQKNTVTSGSGKIKILATFNAVKEFAEAVGKDRVEVTTIIPDGTEPHDYEPKAKDMISLGKADVLIYNGMGMETWVKNAVAAAGSKKLITVEASKGVMPIKNTDSSETGEHGQYDPHVFISLKCAEIEAQNIEKSLAKADPENSGYYKKNCESFNSQLESLYKEYYKKFKTAKRKSIVTGHAAFAYLCRDFGLTQKSVENVFAEGEPSAQELQSLIEYCKKENVKTVFAETMVSPAVSKALASSVGAGVKTIYTFESSEDGKSYLQRMKINLSEIYASLSE